MKQSILILKFMQEMKIHKEKEMMKIKLLHLRKKTDQTLQETKRLSNSKTYSTSKAVAVILAVTCVFCLYNIHLDFQRIKNMNQNYLILLEETEQKESEISDLSFSNDCNTKTIDSLHDTVNDLNSQIESLHKDLDEKNTEIDNLNNQLKKDNGTKEVSANKQVIENSNSNNVDTSKGTPKTFRITFYSGDNATASGARPTAYHTCATGSGYPFGTKIYVPSIGILTVEDRGNPSVVTNNVIDVFMNGSQSELMQMGTRNETCYVLN